MPHRTLGGMEASAVSPEWRPDVLGPGFECHEIDLGSDEEGPLVATLVRSLPDERRIFERLTSPPRPLEGVDVLYVHGWSDYFFQRSLARFWTDRGARFFALDLRKYGRSLREGQTAGYIEDLTDYDLEIDEALAIIKSEPAGSDRPRRGRRRLLLLGHSTGGLVLSLWAAAHPGRADALILNSPWLEFQLSGAGRQMIAPLVNLRARFNLRDAAPQFDSGFYTRAQREVGPREELDLVNTMWRPDRSHTVVNGWLRAILAGHAQVSRGLHLHAPILMLLSARSALPLRWDPSLTAADTVLDVDEVAKAALHLGSSLTVERLDGALHDVFLSRAEVRAEAFARMDRWLTGWARSEAGPGLVAASSSAQRPSPSARSKAAEGATD